MLLSRGNCLRLRQTRTSCELLLKRVNHSLWLTNALPLKGQGRSVQGMYYKGCGGGGATLQHRFMAWKVYDKCVACRKTCAACHAWPLISTYRCAVFRLLFYCCAYFYCHAHTHTHSHTSRDQEASVRESESENANANESKSEGKKQLSAWLNYKNLIIFTRCAARSEVKEMRNRILCVRAKVCYKKSSWASQHTPRASHSLNWRKCCWAAAAAGANL